MGPHSGLVMMPLVPQAPSLSLGWDGMGCPRQGCSVEGKNGKKGGVFKKHPEPASPLGSPLSLPRKSRSGGA